MSFEQIYRRVTDVLGHERIILLVMTVASSYALLDTFQFDISSAVRFPRLTSSVVLIGALLLLFRGYLPKPVREFVAEPADVLKTDDGISEQAEERVDEADEASTEGQLSTVGRPIHDSVFAAIAVSVYGLLGYAIGLLWATPLFVVAYGVWFKQSWVRIAVLGVLGLLITFGFMTAIGIPLDRGEILLTEGVF